MSNQTIECTVDACQHWKSGNLCNLQTITVKKHGTSGGGGGLMSALTGGGGGNSVTDTDTFCASFDRK